MIAWVDLEAPDVGERIDEVGDKSVVSGESGRGPRTRRTRTGWQETTFAGAFRAVASRGHVVELLVKTAHLPHVPQIAHENDGCED